MSQARSVRAEEILDHAMRLFAERGYELTSVADIQVAAGMTPGSGALYKHFASKEKLLEAGIERFIAEGSSGGVDLPAIDPDDVSVALREVGQVVLDTLRLDEAGLRIAWRDLPAFPELKQRVLDERIQVAFARFAQWLTRDSGRAVLTVRDPEATAMILLSALAFFGLMNTMLEAVPGDIGEQRFLDAWTDIAASLLKVSPVD